MRTVNWSKLPNEILLNIFLRNDHNTNSQCSLTCRDWKHPAQCTLFGRITISSEIQLNELSIALSIYQNNSYSINFGQSPGNYVKIVDCELSSNTFDWKLLDSLFPFLEVIEARYHMELPYKDLYKLLKEGKFPHLKTLPSTESNMPPPELLLDRKEKIEELRLYISSLEDKMLQNLHLFPNLKFLYLNYPQEVHLEHFFSKEILHVKSIGIVFGCGSKMGPSNCRNSDTSVLNMEDIQPFPNTKKLRIYSRYFYHDDKYILYIMKKFPKLETLERYDWELYSGRARYYVHPTMDCLFQYLVYLFKMSSFANMITNKFTIQLVKKFLNYVIDQQKVYYKNKIITLGIVFNLVDPEQEHDYLLDHTENLFIDTRKSDIYKKDKCRLTVNYQIRQETTFQSHLQLFREVGGMDIRCLTISAFNFSSTPIVIFDEIFIHFSKLENLTISQISNFAWNKEESLVAETLNSTIRYMQYEQCTLSKDMFPMISKRCTNLKTLNLINCQYNNNNEDQAIPHYFPIVMPSTCLEELLIKFEETRTLLYKKVFIRLITNNKKPRYCKITTIPGLPIVDFPEQDYTEAHYNMYLDDEECRVFDIHCESVVKLVVQFETVDFESESMLIEKCKFLKVEYEIEDGGFQEKKEYIEEDL